MASDQPWGLSPCTRTSIRGQRLRLTRITGRSPSATSVPSGAQDDGDRLAGGGFVDVDRWEAVPAMVGVEAREPLAPVHRILGVVDGEHDPARMWCTGSGEHVSVRQQVSRSALPDRRSTSASESTRRGQPVAVEDDCALPAIDDEPDRAKALSAAAAAGPSAMSLPPQSE